jgi:hypothetical protein
MISVACGPVGLQRWNGSESLGSRGGYLPTGYLPPTVGVVSVSDLSASIGRCGKTGCGRSGFAGWITTNHSHEVVRACDRFEGEAGGVMAASGRRVEKHGAQIAYSCISTRIGITRLDQGFPSR